MKTAAGQRLEFKEVTEPSELEQVHRLHYRTFVEEIPQHGGNPAGVLVDRFEPWSTYFIARLGERVVGTIALNEHRPFSLDDKVPNLDEYLPQLRRARVCELRLLAVEPEHRNGMVFRGLIREIARHCIPKGIDTYVISGAVRQLKLYRHVGFIPFGPIVGTEDAPYQPMYLTLDAYRRSSAHAFEVDPGASVTEMEPPGEPLRFLPGPVDMHPAVLTALASQPLSHRDHQFAREMTELKQLLCRLTDASSVEVVIGTGTLPTT